jgi:PAS domain S-box-containing protein
MNRRRFLILAQLLGVAAIYFAAAWLGLSMASVHTSVSPVWPPTGIAIAAVLLLGYRVSPGILLGAFLANYFLTPVHITTAGGIALGNTLEALSAGLLLRFLNFHNSLDRAKDVFQFVFATLACTMVSATIGNLSLSLGHDGRWDQFGPLWLTWWLGDAVGGLVLAPLLLTWGARSRQWLPTRRYLEVSLLLLLLSVSAMATFSRSAPLSARYFSLSRLIVPFFLWAAFRLGQRGVTLASALLSVFAVWGTAHGAGPFISSTPNDSLLLLQLFLGSNAVTFLFLVVVVEERRLSEETVRESERRVAGNLAITRILAESPALSNATPRLLQTIGEALGWEVGSIWTPDVDANVLRCLNIWHAPSAKAERFESVSYERTLAPGVGLPGRVWTSLKPAWIPDVTKDENFPRASVAVAEGLHAAFAFPILFGDKFLGVMEFFSHEIREPDDALLAMFGSIGSQVGQFMERKLVEEAVKENEERTRLILDTALDAVVMIDGQGSITDWNPQAERIFGWTKPEVIGRELAETIIPLQHREAHERGFRHYLNTGVGPLLRKRIEITALHRDGREFPVELSITPVGFGNQVYFSAFVRDITERKHAEEALRESEEQLRLALDAARMGAWDYDIQTGAVKWSNKLELIHGLLPGSFGGTFDDYQMDIHPDDRQQVIESLTRTIEHGEEHAIEYRIIRPDGATRWVEGKGQVIRDDGGRAIRLTGVCTDITERKQAEAERAQLLAREQTARIEAEKATEMTKRVQAVTDTALQHLALDDLLHEMLVRIRDLLDCDSVAILLLSDDGQCLTVRAALGLEEEVADEVRVPMGRGIAGHIAANCLPLIVDDVSSVEVVTSLLREKIRCLIGAPLLVEGRILGVIHADRAEARLFRQEDLRLLQLVADRIALAMDRARLYEAEQNARIQAEEANRTKDEFLATVSHELRTPLNAIVGWCGMLRSGRLDKPTVDRAIEIIDRNAKVQAQLIEDILDVSRIITGKLGLDVRPVELAQIIEAAVDSVRLAAEAKGIRVQSLLDPRTSPVSGDPNRLQQIVWNLLSNAVKFTPKGGQVQIHLRAIDSGVEIIVSDTGQGISKEFLPYVFEQFRQADSATTRRFGGLGLGLAIVRHLVELHGGTIQAESAGIGQGATFTVRLPVMIGTEPANEPGEYAAGRQYAAARLSLSGLRVLAVDDEADARELLTAMLSKCDAQVKATASASEALEVLADWQPDVLISDIEMPDIDGYSLIRRVRELEADRGGQIPAVALTAHARVEDRLRALRAGFQIHVSKPIEPNELAMVLASLTGRITRQVGRDTQTSPVGS